jgi:hypothetical protein
METEHIIVYDSRPFGSVKEDPSWWKHSKGWLFFSVYLNHGFMEIGIIPSLRNGFPNCHSSASHLLHDCLWPPYCWWGEVVVPQGLALSLSHLHNSYINKSISCWMLARCSNLVPWIKTIGRKFYKHTYNHQTVNCKTDMIIR